MLSCLEDCILSTVPTSFLWHLSSEYSEARRIWAHVHILLKANNTIVTTTTTTAKTIELESCTTGILSFKSEREIKTFRNKNWGIHNHYSCPERNSSSGIGRLNIVKMSVLPNDIYRLNAMSIKILTMFYAEIEKNILKFVWNLK